MLVVPEAFTCCVMLVDVLLEKLGSVEVKVAVITWLPAVVKVCEQVTGEGAPAVIVVEQNGLPATSSVSLKDTVPDCGVAVPGNPEPVFVAAKVADNVTLWLTVDGFTGEETVVVVAAALTVCATLGALPAAKLESPL